MTKSRKGIKKFMGTNSDLGWWLVAGGAVFGIAYLTNLFGLKDLLRGKKDHKDMGPMDEGGFDSAKRIGYTAAQTPLGYVIAVDPEKGRTVFNKAYFGKAHQAVTVS